MKKKLLYIPIVSSIVLFSIVLSSCEDWLTVPPENDLIKENFWKKTDDVYGALGAMYDAFRETSLNSFIHGELRADMVRMSSVNFGNYQSIAESDISSSNSAVDWRGYYNTINLANTLMYYNKQVYELDETFTKEMLDAVDAEALFIRSLSFFYLVKLYKDVPLVIHPSLSDTSNLFIAKKTEKQVLAQVIKDLEKAKDLAYTTKFKDEDDPKQWLGRANKYSIMALLADVYLWDEQYEKAVEYCDEIINSNLFALETADKWFEIYYPGNSMVEGIFEIQFDDNLDNQENPMYDNLFPFSGVLGMSPKADKLRLLLTEDDYRTCNIANPKLAQPLNKYYVTNLTSISARTQNQRDANVIYYRYADVLLTKADALNELGQTTESNAFLSQTKERAGLSHVDINVQSELRLAILEERNKEFLLEGKRWFDVLRVAKRNNYENKHLIIEMILAGADIKQQAILRAKVFDTQSYFLPIPEWDIITNPNLEQNPYYER